MRVLICFGTRPEYIKVKSLITHLKEIKTCFTGQHEDLIHVNEVDYKLKIENTNKNRLNSIFTSIMKYSHIFNDIDYVLVQGDTTTAAAMAISAFNHRKKVIHLEAGLRSHNTNDPYPEEINRQLISRIAEIHLCPTSLNKENLLKEGITKPIHIVGNTGLDNITKTDCVYSNKVLITLHRRDNHPIMDKWFEIIEKIANKYDTLEFIIPLHPNPNVQKHKNLFKKVNVVEPMNHPDVVNYVKQCRFVISDSGGLQEECSFLNKKIIVCRKKTERLESLNIHSFLCTSPELLENIVDQVYKDHIVTEICPYGDGKSWKKIIDCLTML